MTSIAPADVLLFAPRGFSPVQALFDRPLALVGRGLADPADGLGFAPLPPGSLETMREGWTAINAFRNALVWPDARDVPFGIIPPSRAGPTRRGSSAETPAAPCSPAALRAAPANASSVWRPPALLGSISVHAPTFRLPNNTFLYQQLHGTPALCRRAAGHRW